jgi:hypothetical protein
LKQVYVYSLWAVGVGEGLNEEPPRGLVTSILTPPAQQQSCLIS